MNSTPSSPTCTMRLTALLPPPPTPTTLIRAPARTSSASFNRSVVSRCSAIHRPPSEELFEQSAEPPGHPAQRPRTDKAPRLDDVIPLRVQDKPHRCCK